MSNLVPLIVVLGLPRSQSVAPLIVKVTAIADAMAADPTAYPAPNPALTKVRTDLTALTGKETALKNRLGNRADRDAARSVVIADAHGLQVYVQQLVNQNPAQAESLAVGAAMSLRKSGAHNKADLAVHPKISGTVQVVAKALKGARSHDWEYSADGGKTWIAVPSTTKSSTVITGLLPGSTVTYRHRALTTAGPTDWSQPVTAVVT